MKKNQIILAIILIFFSVSLALLNRATSKETLQVNASTLSNKKIGWGIKKNDNHEQPDVGAQNKQLLDQYSGLCLGNKEEKVVYLTFDQGYEAGYTNQILDALKEKQVPATFFITGHYINTASDIVQRMIDEGHIVGNHTVNHKSMPEIGDKELEEEIMKLHQTMYEKYGYEMKYLRPPKGEFSERTLSICKNLGYKNVMWSFAYVDWNEDSQPNESEAKQTILNNLHNGEIILLHATSKTNANILDSVLKEIKAQGYEIKSLDEFK